MLLVGRQTLHTRQHNAISVEDSHTNNFRHIEVSLCYSTIVLSISVNIVITVVNSLTGISVRDAFPATIW